MIVPLFLDTTDCRHFSDDSRQAVEEICAAADMEIRAHLGALLPHDIELACQTGQFVIPETGEVGAAITSHHRLDGQSGAIERDRRHRSHAVTLHVVPCAPSSGTRLGDVWRAGAHLLHGRRCQ